MSYNFMNVEEMGKVLMSTPFNQDTQANIPSIHFIHQKIFMSNMKNKYEMAIAQWHRMGVCRKILCCIKFTHVQHRYISWVQHAKYNLIDGCIFSIHSAACVRPEWGENGVTGESYQIGLQVQKHVDQILLLPHSTYIIPVPNSDGMSMHTSQLHDTPHRGKVASGVLISKDVGDFNNALLSCIICAIKNAKTSIDILTPNYNSIIIFKAFPKSNVQVRIIVFSGHNETFLHPLYFPKSYVFAQKNQSPNILLRYYGRSGSRGHGPTRSGRDAVMHSKLLIVDGRWVFFGSMNMDRFSTSGQSEAALLIDSTDVANDATKQFERYWIDSNLHH
jgi:hypothetical protein